MSLTRLVTRLFCSIWLSRILFSSRSSATRPLICDINSSRGRLAAAAASIRSIISGRIASAASRTLAMLAELICKEGSSSCSAGGAVGCGACRARRGRGRRSPHRFHWGGTAWPRAAAWVRCASGAGPASAVTSVVTRSRSCSRLRSSPTVGAFFETIIRICCASAPRDSFATICRSTFASIIGRSRSRERASPSFQPSPSGNLRTGCSLIYATSYASFRPSGGHSRWNRRSRSAPCRLPFRRRPWPRSPFRRSPPRLRASAHTE